MHFSLSRLITDWDIMNHCAKLKHLVVWSLSRVSCELVITGSPRMTRSIAKVTDLWALLPSRSQLKEMPSGDLDRGSLFLSHTHIRMLISSFYSSKTAISSCFSFASEVSSLGQSAIQICK